MYFFEFQSRLPVRDQHWLFKKKFIYDIYHYKAFFEQNSNLDKKSFNFESVTCQRSKISSDDLQKKNQYYAFF